MEVIPNSIGKQLLGYFASTQTKQSSVREETGRELVRAVLALRLYAMDHAAGLPGSLQDLVARRYLSIQPIDWFSLAPLRYDRTRRVVYSVGPEEDDHGGKFTEELRFGNEGVYGVFIDEPKLKPKPKASPTLGRVMGS
jgi:hypothetical protein